MGSARVQHSKYKNTGILFELLARQVTVDVINGIEQSPALKIMRRKFHPSTELGKELSLYRSIFESKRLSETKSIKFLDLVIEQRCRLNTKKLNQEKYDLVSEIKDEYPLKDFLSSPISQYKIYASIYKMFLAESLPHKVKVASFNDVTQSRFAIVEHMTQERSPKQADNNLLESLKSQQEDLRLLTYRILVDKFNDKYQGLNEQQRVLLRKYINNVSNTNSLREYVNIEIPEIKRQLHRKIPSIQSKVTRIKLEEAIKQMDSITKGKVVRDNQVTALMIAYQLLREIDNV